MTTWLHSPARLGGEAALRARARQDAAARAVVALVVALSFLVGCRGGTDSAQAPSRPPVVPPPAKPVPVAAEAPKPVGKPRNSWAGAINNHGVIVGDSDTSDGVQRAFVWTPGTGAGGRMEDLGKADDRYSGASTAFGVNDEGLVVGARPRHAAVSRQVPGCAP